MKALLVAFTALIATPAFADDVSHLTPVPLGFLPRQTSDAFVRYDPTAGFSTHAPSKRLTD